jgi:UDP-N-acetyl-D-mannosaminuronate dehydrogenase
MFYGPRLAKCNKKYTMYKNFKEKQKQLDEQKEAEMVDIMEDFFVELNEKITMKDRITEAKN